MYRNRYHGRRMNDSATEKNGKNWWQRLAGGLRRSSSALGGAISDLVSKRKLDAATITEIEDVLIRADLGLDNGGSDRRSAPRRPLRHGDLAGRG